MTIEALLKESKLAQMGARVVASVSIPADLETPVSAYLKLRNHGAKFLLESVEGGTIVGRYSFIGMEPESKIIIDQTSFNIKKNGDEVSIPLDKV